MKYLYERFMRRWSHEAWRTFYAATGGMVAGLGLAFMAVGSFYVGLWVGTFGGAVIAFSAHLATISVAGEAKRVAKHRTGVKQKL